MSLASTARKNSPSTPCSYGLHVNRNTAVLQDRAHHHPLRGRLRRPERRENRGNDPDTVPGSRRNAGKSTRSPDLHKIEARGSRTAVLFEATQHDTR